MERGGVGLGLWTEPVEGGPSSQVMRAGDREQGSEHLLRKRWLG